MRTPSAVSVSVVAVAIGFFTAAPVAAQQPLAQFKNVPQNALVNDTFKFCVTFKNNAAPAGMGPFIDLELPEDPVNGNTPCDGIRFVSATVTSTNPNVPLTLVPNPNSGGCGWGGGTVNHPFGPIIPPLALSAGVRLITLALPFGSYQPPPQPDISIEVTAKIDINANVGAPLPVMRVRGGFRFSGQVQPFVTAPNVTPQVLILHSSYAGADQETVAGPNFPKNFTVTGDVAPGQILNGMAIQQCLPAGGIWTGAPAGTGGSWTWSTNLPCFTGTATITGTGANTFTIVRPAYFDFTLLSGAPLCKTPTTDNATVTAGTTPAHDPLDPTPIQLTTTPPVPLTVDVKALAIQKAPQPPVTPLPGGTVTYNADFQANDYQQFGALVIKDTMSDGLQFASATLSVNDKNGSVASVPIAPTPSTGTPIPSGTYQCPPPDPSSCAPPNPLNGPITLPSATQYTFDISAALVSAGHPGTLTGGNFGGTSSIPATGTLSITANVLDSFLYGTHGGQDNKVDKDDPLLNRCDITAATVAHISHICTDDGNSCLAVPADILEKKAVAVNGNPIPPATLGGPNVTVGDKITFRETKTIDTGDFESLTIQDFLPLPALQATVPIAMSVCGPLVNCYLSTPTVPPCPMIPTIVAANSNNNSYTFNFGTCNDIGNHPRTITIYTTHQVQPTPMPDGLLLTNEAQECEKNSYGTPFCQAAIAQFKVQEPYLTIKKGVCGGACQNNYQPSICPGCPIGTFTDGTVGNYLGSPMIYADASDHIQFALAVINTGTGPLGAFDVVIKDHLAAGFPGHITGALCIKRGDGAALTPNFVLNSSTSFTLSFGANPVLGSAPSTTGANVLLVIYDVVIDPPQQLVTNGCWSNQGHIDHYSNKAGGPDFVAAGLVGLDATAQVCVRPHGLLKTLVSTSEADPGAPKVAIGNLVHYDEKVIIPQGTSTFSIVENLPPGFSIVDPTTVTVSTGLPNIAPITHSGSAAHPTLGPLTITNPNTASACDTATLHVTAQVMNSTPNAHLTTFTKDNTFTIGNETSNPVSVTLVEPKLDVTKTVTQYPTTVMNWKFDVTVTNNPLHSNATAFDVVIKDLMPSCFVLVTGLPLTFHVPPGATPGGAFPTYTVDRLKVGESATLSFIVFSTCGTDCAKVINNVHVEWTSEPGPQGTANATPGIACASNGERCGHGNPLWNYYYADASASLCGKVCGMKFADLPPSPNVPPNGVHDPNEPVLSGWPIFAGTNTTTTDSNGQYCLSFFAGFPLTVNVCEGTFSFWTPTNPATGCRSVTVTMNTTTAVDFGNKPECFAQLCGHKITPPGQSPGGWVITATPPAGSGPTVMQTTQPDGSYCMTLFGPNTYTIAEQPKTGWAQTLPVSGTYSVKVTCTGGGGAITGVPNPNAVDFANKNVCANVNCPIGFHCEVGSNQQAQCVSDIISRSQ